MKTSYTDFTRFCEKHFLKDKKLFWCAKNGLTANFSQQKQSLFLKKKILQFLKTKAVCAKQGNNFHCLLLLWQI